MQILDNFISNAIKFSPSGNRVVVSASLLEASVISVSEKDEFDVSAGDLHVTVSALTDDDDGSSGSKAKSTNRCCRRRCCAGAAWPSGARAAARSNRRLAAFTSRARLMQLGDNDAYSVSRTIGSITPQVVLQLGLATPALKGPYSMCIV